MTLDVTLLARLAEWRPGPGRQTLTLADKNSGWTVTVTADRSDVLGCLVWEMALRRAAPLGADAAGLRAWGDRIANRVTGLLEPLKLIEVDRERGEAFLRSDAPAARGNELFYYEVFLTSAGVASVRRYRGRHGDCRRQQVAFALTHEALAKLAADLTAEQ